MRSRSSLSVAARGTALGCIAAGLGLVIHAQRPATAPVQRAVAVARHIAAIAPPVAGQLVDYTEPASPASPLIHVGLSTKGAPLSFWSRGALTIQDIDRPDSRLAVPAEQALTLTWFPASSAGDKPPAHLQVSLQGQTFNMGARDRITSGGEPTHVSSNGNSPADQRAYRGDFEISQQGYTFEEATHKGPLRLVNIVSLDDYLKGVVPWEMERSAPLEALKAQAICARSETLAKIHDGRHARDGYDICDYDHCEGYCGTENECEASNAAVDQTSGLVVYYHDQIADAVYGTNSGGITSAAEDVWSGSPEPYLRSVHDFPPSSRTAQTVKAHMNEDDWAAYCTQDLPSFAEPSTSEKRYLASRRRTSPRTASLYQESDLPEFYRWTRIVSAHDVAQAMAAQVRMDDATAIKVVERSPSGHIKRLEIDGVAGKDAVSVTLKGDSHIRSMLSGRLGSTTALPSSTFVVVPVRDDKGTATHFVLHGAGWGHGAGMCQRGAQTHAAQGWTAQQIVEFYFHDVKVRKMG